MEGQCFFRSHQSDEVKKFYNEPCDINLDSALNELGMLSTITTSRIDYLKEQELDCLKEKVKKKCCSNSICAAPLCVVHMNSDFVTQFSLSKNSYSAAGRYSRDPVTVIRHRRRAEDRRRNLSYTPYHLKERRKPPEKTCELFSYNGKLPSMPNIPAMPDIPDEDRASPPIISRQDSGNKSNPSSPVKSQNSLTPVGCSIFRSRSLDDLEISKLNNLNENCDIRASHGEIDIMSQRISKLQVS